MTETELCQTVRRAYNYACGYCGVHENEVGSELEIDHFQPRVAGGGDAIENLVYCCTTCNRLKSDFWTEVSNENRILHPQRDSINEHLHLNENGLLDALTKTGAFHLSRLRLNRQPLIASRRARNENEILRLQLNEAEQTRELLLRRFAELDSELERVLSEINSFLAN